MSSKKGFESFNESTNVSEIFDFPESRNQSQLLNENFVFNFEENGAQTGLDYNDPYLGLEDNPNEEERKVEQELSRDDKKDLQNNADGTANAQASEVTSSSSASSSAAASSTSGAAASSGVAAGASGVIATVAATATAAVVLVVGGGMAIYGQGLDQPTICEFDQIAAVENNINFKLAVGNNREKINSGEEKDECDIYVELKCPSIEDFEQRVNVPTYGITESSFTNLEYDTEYVVTVYQNMMMLDNADALTSPISIWTEKKVVPPEPGPEPGPEPEPGELGGDIKIYKVNAPLGNHSYQMEVVPDGDFGAYDSYAVGVNPIVDGADGDSASEQEKTWYYTFPYDATEMGKQNLDITDSDLQFAKYEFGFLGIDESGVSTVLFTDEVAVADIEDIDYDRDETCLYLFYTRVIKSEGEEITYTAFFNYNEDIHGELTGRIKVEAQGLSDTEPFMVSYIQSPNEEYELSEWNLGDHSYRGKYTVRVSDVQDESTTVLWEEDVSFGQLPNNTYRYPKINDVKFLIGQNADESVDALYVDIDYTDSSGIWNDHLFTVQLNSSSGTDYECITSDYPTLANRFRLDSFDAGVIGTESQSEFNYTISYDGEVVYTSSETFLLYQVDTFIIDGSVNFYLQANPTGGTNLKYNMYFSSVYESYSMIYITFNPGTMSFDPFDETVSEFNKPQDFNNDTTDLLNDDAVKVQTFGIIDGSPNLIHEATVNFADLPTYREASVDSLSFSIGSYSAVKDYLFANLVVVDPAHEWRGQFEVTLTSTDTPSYSYSSTLDAYYESGRQYLGNIDVGTLFETQEEEYTVTLTHDGETIYEGDSPITYEDLDTFNITGSIQTRFEPAQGSDIEYLEFMVVDDEEALANVFNLYVTFMNVNDDEDLFSGTNLTTNTYNTTEKTRSELEGNTYYVDTYAQYSENDIAILLTREIVTFS